MPSSPISSRHNPRVKQAAALRGRRQREERGETLVYGARETLRATRVGAQVKVAFLCQELFPHAEARQAADDLRTQGVETLDVTTEVFQKLAYGDRTDGVVTVVATRDRPLGDLSVEATPPLIAVIEGVEKPGNLGALLRTADGAGVDAVLVADPVIDLYNPNAIRASVATVFKPNIAVGSSQECRDWLESEGVPVFATKPAASQPYWDANLAGPAAIVFGAESHGLTDAWDSPSIQAIALPMQGLGDSLNLAASAAVLLYEARRQRSV